ncbi:septum formation initiator family protein [Hephaestia sp. GCM10023244]|uniref:FtsB family cell division protein n=1 Tax=unclassified Hephaestia TaxID=2631281 RepID=UPI0020771078|nr:septum formation initiator family protein [Hephaestia sp. MAHUQ-44]MCM8730007.1 septum formation initiator family protein [Hephaestia sp. MAHUQ-44]
MKKRSTFAVLLRRTWLPALALVVMAFFGGYAVLGPNGVLAYGEYKHQLAAKKVTYEALDHQRAELRNRVDLLDARHANPDLVDELARKKLNVVHPDEIIVPLN